jgi:predicted PurR-regulated permease PerM
MMWMYTLLRDACAIFGAIFIAIIVVGSIIGMTGLTVSIPLIWFVSAMLAYVKAELIDWPKEK